MVTDWQFVDRMPEAKLFVSWTWDMDANSKHLVVVVAPAERRLEEQEQAVWTAWWHNKDSCDGVVGVVVVRQERTGLDAYQIWTGRTFVDNMELWDWSWTWSDRGLEFPTMICFVSQLQSQYLYLQS